MSEHVIKIQDGNAEFVYDDDLAPVAEAMGTATVTRASHVEPHPSRPGWLADMRPSGGPVLGVGCEAKAMPRGWAGPAPVLTSRQVEALEPFATREAALAAERQWLRENRGL